MLVNQMEVFDGQVALFLFPQFERQAAALVLAKATAISKPASRSGWSIYPA